MVIELYVELVEEYTFDVKLVYVCTFYVEQVDIYLMWESKWCMQFNV